VVGFIKPQGQFMQDLTVWLTDVVETRGVDKNDFLALVFAFVYLNALRDCQGLETGHKIVKGLVYLIRGCHQCRSQCLREQNVI